MNRYWEPGGDMPAPLGFAAIAKRDGYIYLLGGISRDDKSMFASARIFVGKLNAQGQFYWKFGAPITTPFLHATAEVLGGTLYLMGGLGGNAGKVEHPQALVIMAQLGADGLNGTWSASASLPQARSHHASVVYNNRIYLIGGFDENNAPLKDILRSVHNTEGLLTGWETAGTIDPSPWTHGASVVDGWLYVVGGGEGGNGAEKYINRIRRARFDATGKIESFEDVSAPLPVARSHVHQAPTINNHIYSVGGRLQEDYSSMARVFVGTLK